MIGVPVDRWDSRLEYLRRCASGLSINATNDASPVAALVMAEASRVLSQLHILV